MDYWRNNSYYIEFQNHRAAFIISGKNFIVDGFGTGGIYGNGDVWYDHDEGPPSSEGRPMVSFLETAVWVQLHDWP